MKKVLYIVTLLFGLLSYCQQNGSISLEWTINTSFSYESRSVILPHFDEKNFSYDDVKNQIFFVKKIAVDGLINENSLQISNIIYEDIDLNELGNLLQKNIPESINSTIKNCISRDKFYALMTISPIIKQENRLKRIKSFDYSFNSNPDFTIKSNVNKNANSIINSVLNTGNWYRFYIEKSGVYRISKDFLNQIGFNTDGVDPRKIKIYGNGGRMLPLSNSVSYPNDLEENAIQVIGENDGTFNSDDYILFYAEGMDNWSEENETHLNLYANKSYYYVTKDGTDGKRITTILEPIGTATQTATKFDDYQFHETDLTNIGRLGRVWFGENFNLIDEQEFTFNFPNIDTTSPTLLKIHTGGNSFVATTFTAKANGQSAGTMNLNQVIPNSGIEAAESSLSTSITSAQNITINLKYNNNGVPTSKGYLDYIALKAKSNLTGYGKQFRFQIDNVANLSGIIQYQFNNSSTIKQIWDITDIYNVKNIDTNNQSNFSFKSNLGVEKKYVAVDENNFYAPENESSSSVTNQNLKGTIFKNSQGNFEDIDYLIITPSSLNSQAEKLANFHRNYSSLNVKVVNLNLIYQEFGGGKQDIGAIRNFIKYVYENASTAVKRVKYVNLFGDASFDFKDRIPNNTNIVPIYHSTNSYTAGEASFASDDFFVNMDFNEGNIEYFIGAPDIAIGRMLISSTNQAEEMINKVFEYHDIKSYGSWRNNYVCIADDSDKTSDASLQVNQNNLTDVIYTQKPFINFKKILLDSYQQMTSAGGDRYPQANEDLTNAFEKGSLIFNYLGHGGEDGLTGERLWDKFDGSNFNNRYRYPLFITLTCDFSRFDNPYRPTAGEYTFWNPKGGAISMITTIRTIGQGGAENFNNSLATNLFNYGSNDYHSIAEALRLTKGSNSNSASGRVIFYLGDPALMLAIPKPKVVLTKVNGVPITQPFADFKALDYITITGEVQDENGNRLNGYNGELSTNIFDKNYTRNTFNNDGYSAPITFNSLGEVIFRGNSSITNGQFEFGFVVPKDIKIPLGNGRISFYAKRNQVLLDKTGYNFDIKIGGINTNAVADVKPPTIRLYMNDETFVNGGITNQSPFFLAFVNDEHGINTASGIGHDIVAILDGDETKPYILNDYYETELNDFTKGKIRFPFRNLAKGLHTIIFKVWDVYNNFATAEIQFFVADDEGITLENVLNYPNPFVSYTQFWFSHNKPYEPLDVQVQIMTITGKIIKSINKQVITDGFLSREITWDGKDDFGDRIGKGVYIYKLTVKSSLSDKKAEKIEKLVIL